MHDGLRTIPQDISIRMSCCETGMNHANKRFTILIERLGSNGNGLGMAQLQYLPSMFFMETGQTASASNFHLHGGRGAATGI